MTRRYALEIHLIEVDGAGNKIASIDFRTTDDVTSDLKGMKEGLVYLHETLNNVVYDHLPDSALLTHRYTGGFTYPDLDEVEIEEDEEDDEWGLDEDEIDCFLGEPFDEDE